MEDKNNNVANAGGRSERWLKSIEHMFTDPLGWDVREFGFSHNLWFDVLRVGGVLSFVLLSIITIRVIKDLLKNLKNENVLLSSKVHLLVYFIAFILIFMVEPILDGMTSLFVLFCLFSGILAQKNSFTISSK